MVKIRKYSTALKKNASEVESGSLFTGKIFPFDWSDKTKVPPTVVLRGDFMYCEPSWRAGFYKYNGKDKEKFAYFMKSLDWLARTYAKRGKPAVIMCGKESRHFLHPTSCVVAGRILVGESVHSDAYAYCYDFIVSPFRSEPLTNYEFIQKMLERGYKTPFDPTVGYGQLYDDFPDLIATDVRSDCVNEVIRHRRSLGYEVI